MKEICLIYFIVINLIGYEMMWSDKRKARRKMFRTPEKTLFLVAGLFGSLGIYAGMKQFRHKTKHKSFVIGIPCIILIQALILIWLWL